MSKLPQRILVSPNRGEIWDVNFDPSVGSEQKKTRPAVVMSVGSVGRLPLRIVVPITEWDDKYRGIPWHIRIPHLLSKNTGLIKESSADAFQVKSVAIERFIAQLGKMPHDQMKEITAAIAICVGFSPKSP